MLKNLLIYRFAIFNILVGTLLGYAHSEGMLAGLLDGDRTGIVMVIATLFGITWLATSRHVWRTSKNLNSIKLLNRLHRNGQFIDGTVVRLSAERDKARYKVEWMRDAGGWLVGLGLIGTVVGFAVALSGVDPASLSQASGVQTAVGELMAGMRIALNTTIAGAVLSLWNEVNQRMLRTALECYWADRVANVAE